VRATPNSRSTSASARRFDRDPAPRTAPTETPDTPAKKARRKRTRLQALAFFGGLGARRPGRPPGGRCWSAGGCICCQRTGPRPGHQLRRGQEDRPLRPDQCRGVKGDLFDDFTIDRVTITDAKGVWLEARNVRVDWDWLPLVTRRFHATEIEADVIRLIRRPRSSRRTTPPGPQPLSVDIDRFAANVELLEGLQPGVWRWRLTGEADIPRRATRTVIVNADSLSRPGDYLRINAVLGRENPGPAAEPARQRGAGRPDRGRPRLFPEPALLSPAPWSTARSSTPR
jgi:translocation and assembly module TamB